MADSWSRMACEYELIMLRAISLHEPWGSLMRVGAKTIETRGRFCHIRGDVAICSAQKKVPIDWISEDLHRVMEQYNLVFSLLPRGYVLCVVEIWDCLPTSLLQGISGPELACGDYGPDRFGWLTRNLRPLKEPVSCMGRQGFFFLPETVEQKVRAQL